MPGAAAVPFASMADVNIATAWVSFLISVSMLIYLSTYFKFHVSF
jgi:hypothetical protein